MTILPPAHSQKPFKYLNVKNLHNYKLELTAEINKFALQHNNLSKLQNFATWDLNYVKKKIIQLS